MNKKNKRTYSEKDIYTALEKAGLKSEDTVFITTSLGMLGIPENVHTQEELNCLFFNALKSFFSKGNIIIPTYSYSFGKSRPNNLATYDPTETPSEIGPFPEYFRQQKGVLRTLDPMMSVAGIGPNIKELFENLPLTSYGYDSIFHRLTKVNSKCCSIGLGANWMPFIHFADYVCKVPFRYDKLFYGKIKKDNEIIETAWLYSVPLLSPASRSTGHIAGNLATEANIWKFAELGRARVYAADYKEYFDFTVDLIKKDPWTTAFGPPADPLLLEQERVQLKSSLSNIKHLAPKDFINKLLTIERTEASAVANEAIDFFAEKYKMLTYAFKTGENHFDTIIPECTTSDEKKFFGEIKIAQLPKVLDSNKTDKYELFITYVNKSHKQEKDYLLGVLEGINRYQSSSSSDKILLILSSPTAFWAWLNQNQNLSSKITKIYEFTGLDSQNLPYSGNYPKNPNIKITNLQNNMLELIEIIQVQ